MTEPNNTRSRTLSLNTPEVKVETDDDGQPVLTITEQSYKSEIEVTVTLSESQILGLTDGCLGWLAEHTDRVGRSDSK